MDSNYLDVYLSEKWVKGEIQKWTILLTFYKNVKNYTNARESGKKNIAKFAALCFFL